MYIFLAEVCQRVIPVFPSPDLLFVGWSWKAGIVEVKKKDYHTLVACTASHFRWGPGDGPIPLTCHLSARLPSCFPDCLFSCPPAWLTTCLSPSQSLSICLHTLASCLPVCLLVCLCPYLYWYRETGHCLRGYPLEDQWAEFIEYTRYEIHVAPKTEHRKEWRLWRKESSHTLSVTASSPWLDTARALWQEDALNHDITCTLRGIHGVK